MTTTDNERQPTGERQRMNVDIVCVGFGPATGGFLTTLSRELVNADGTSRSGGMESAVSPGMPPQVICYERAGDIGFGVSGVVARARGIRQTFPDLDPSQIPMCAPVKHEKVLYLLDPIGASRRSATLCAADKMIRAMKGLLRFECDALELPYIPPYLRKHGGLVMSIGQFNQWVGAQLMSTGTVQIWPSTPVAKPLIEDNRVVGVQLTDQGTDKLGRPDTGFTPGMEIRAALTVVGDGPVGPIGRQLDECFGMPEGCHKRDWAIGMKFVVNLPENCPLEAGTVLHTLGYPEPEIFGFFYVHPDRVASLGIFVPSWFTPPCAPHTVISSTGCCTRICGVTCKAARCVRGARRRSANQAGAASRISLATVTRASAKGLVAPTFSRAAVSTKRGRRASSWPRPSSSC